MQHTKYSTWKSSKYIEIENNVHNIPTDTFLIELSPKSALIQVTSLNVSESVYEKLKPYWPGLVFEFSPIGP